MKARIVVVVYQSWKVEYASPEYDKSRKLAKSLRTAHHLYYY
jgi:hypothetical protein